MVQKCCDMAGARGAAPVCAGEVASSLLSGEKSRGAWGEASALAMASGLASSRWLPGGPAGIQGTAVCHFSTARKENCRLCEK